MKDNEVAEVAVVLARQDTRIADLEAALAAAEQRAADAEADAENAEDAMDALARALTAAEDWVMRWEQAAKASWQTVRALRRQCQDAEARAEAAEAEAASLHTQIGRVEYGRDIAFTKIGELATELEPLRAALMNADAHHGLVPSIEMLREEVDELEAALAGNHSHPPELELTQIGGIVINWLRQYDLIPIPVGSSKLTALRAVAEAAQDVLCNVFEGFIEKGWRYPCPHTQRLNDALVAWVSWAQLKNEAGG